MSARIERAQAVLKEQLAEISAEEKELRQALATLDGGSATKPAKGSQRKKRRRRRAKRAKKGQRRKEVLAALKANPDAKTSEIARQIGISSNQVSALKAKLAKEQKKQTPRVRSKRGEKKATPKAARSPKKTSAKSGTKKGAKKSSKGKARAKGSKAPKASSTEAAQK